MSIRIESLIKEEIYVGFLSVEINCDSGSPHFFYTYTDEHISRNEIVTRALADFKFCHDFPSHEVRFIKEVSFRDYNFEV